MLVVVWVMFRVPAKILTNTDFQNEKNLEGKINNYFCPEFRENPSYVIPPVIVTGPTDQSPTDILDNDVFNFTSKWNADQFEEVQFQIIRMHSVSFGIALMTIILLGVLYNKEKVGAPNIAEARRLSIGTVDRPRTVK